MCTPDLGIGEAIAIGSALASAGGAVVNANAAASNQASAINAKNAATARLIAQEDQRQKEASGIFDQTMGAWQDDKPQQNLQTAQAANTAAIQSNTPGEAALLGGATTGNAPQVVQDSAKNSVASRVKSLGQKGAALGTLTGYDSNNQSNFRNIADARTKIGSVGNFANTDAMVGNAQMNADIANSQQPISPFGDLLGAAGQLGGYYAGKNGAFDNLFGTKKVPDVFGGISRTSVPTGFYSSVR